MKDKSILFVSLLNGATWGGSEELWFKTAIYASNRGYKVSCACYDWAGKNEKIDALRTFGCEIILIPNTGRLKRNWKEKWRYKLITAYEQKRVVDELKNMKFDHVVVNQSGFLDVTNKPWDDFFKSFKNITLVFHNYNERYKFSRRRAIRLKNWLANTKLNLFAAKRMQKVIELQLDYSVSNSGLLLNPISFPAPYAFNPFDNTSKGLRMVMLASLNVKFKAQDNLIKALSLDKWKTRDWQLDLFGSGPDISLLKKLIENAGLEEKIKLRGHTSDVQSTLADAHILLQITHLDAMPISVVEAMAMSRPVVVSRIGDMPEWVKEGENGWIAQNASIEEIGKTLDKMWVNRLKLEEMGRNSYDIFKSKFPESAEVYFLNQIVSD